VEKRLRGDHVVPPLLQSARNPFELLGPRRAVVRVGGLVVVPERGVVLALCVRIRLDWLLELLHVVGECDQVVVRRCLDLGELGLRAPAVAHGPSDQKRDRAEDQEADQDAAAGAGPVVPVSAGSAALLLSCDTVNEVDERRGYTVATVRVERLGREAAGHALRQNPFAAGAKVATDDGGVRARAAEPVMQGLQDTVGISAGLVLGGQRKNRDVDRPGAGTVDRLAQPALVGGADGELGRRVDVQRIGSQRGDGGVDALAGLRRCAD
jgi:hypothetical protein